MSTSVAPARSRYHHGDLRRALLDAGVAVARDLGSEALSLREVARRAGVSHTAAYNHFADKNDLLRAIATLAFERLTRDLETAAAADSLEEIAAVYVRFAVENAAEFRFMFSHALCMPPGEPDPLEDAGRASLAVVAALVQRLVASGALAPGDPEQIALVAWSQAHGLATIVLETPAFTDLPVDEAERLGRAGARAMLVGLAARDTLGRGVGA